MKKILLLITAFCIVLLLTVSVFLLINSPGKTTQLRSVGGESLADSIAEIRNVSINGVSQRLLIRGVDKNNPLLLHLHGGPGGPDQVILQQFDKTLEDIFTVVYWDQRGSGASYHSSMADQSLTLADIVNDGITVSEMLLNEFGQDQLYLHGHSWGTLLGVNMVSEAPELFKAFFAVGLFADSQRSEKLSWDYAISSARAAGDKKTVERLNKIGSPPYKSDRQWIQSVTEQRQLLWPYENPDAEPLYTTAEIYRWFALYNGYTLAEKFNVLSGLNYSMEKLWPTVVSTNLMNTHTNLAVPIYVFQGKYDQHTVTEVAKDYFNKIIAPDKQYHLFENSAHWPHVSEYDLYRARIERHLQTIEGRQDK